MANHPSAEKRNRQATKQRLRNRTVRGRMRTAIKATLKAIEEGRKEDAQALAKESYRLIDRAYSKNVVKRNKASRLISRLHARVNA